MNLIDGERDTDVELLSDTDDKVCAVGHCGFVCNAASLQVVLPPNKTKCAGRRNGRATNAAGNFAKTHGNFYNLSFNVFGVFVFESIRYLS